VEDDVVFSSSPTTSQAVDSIPMDSCYSNCIQGSMITGNPICRSAVCYHHDPFQDQTGFAGNANKCKPDLKATILWEKNQRFV
jgi:hypothetical protein